MPDHAVRVIFIIFTTVGYVVVAWLAYREGRRRGDASGYSRGRVDGHVQGHAAGLAQEREKARLVAEESARERVARIARNRSDGARKAWRTRRGEDK